MLAFVHVTSHGCINKHDDETRTQIVHGDPIEYTNIELMLEKLSRAANVFVFAILDCCRNIILQKNSEKKEKKMIGQLHICFAARPN